MSVRIRKALSSEINLLLSFEAGIVAAERPFDSTLKKGEIHYYNLLEMIVSEQASVVVAEINNEIVGSGYSKIAIGESYQSFEQYVHLGFMYVKAAYRRQGINQKILNHLIEWSKSKNITEVRLQVYDENVNAKNSYLKFGFKPAMIEMRMDLLQHGHKEQ